MATIHIEPLPSRCSAGVVLAFVCNGGSIDRRHIGKITLLGRGATVEVPDEKAAKLVATLDGTALSERPVRVRFAGPAGFADGNPFAHLSALLDLEAKAEEDEARRVARSDTGGRDGVSLASLILAESEFGLGGRLLLTFTLRSRSHRFPPNRLQPGSPVTVNQTGVNRRVPTYRGVVYDRDERTIGVAIDPPDDDLPDEATWRLDLMPDEVSRLRQHDVLRRAAEADGDRLADLRDILLGEREPVWASSAPIEIATHLNESQAEAVRFCLAAKDVAVIHGPPGTGKTTTLVEVIRLAVARGDRVLACAPSNHAVDNLLAKLLAVGERPVRIGHPARIDPALRDRALDLLIPKHPDAKQARKFAKDAFTLFREADKWTRDKPQRGEKAALRKEARALLAEARKGEAATAGKILDEARVVCGTLTGLTSDVLGQRRFDLVVIDEAGQATEPASWLPLPRANTLVLAGDHCQLPPTVLSPEAAERGLAISLMERVVGRYGTKIARLLSIQYRMHAEIMGFSNAEFYGGELIANESVVRHRLCDEAAIVESPFTNRAVRFVDTAGAGYDEEPEEESGSRRNRQEADLAVRYVRRLIDAGVPDGEIGVITPYRAQVRLLRESLGDVPDLEVDSVDGFQGREKNAIIVSLVRSNPQGEIGFLADTRRTNVAFTRARKSLVVIGDSATLCHDPFYQRMIAYFEAMGAYGTVWEEETGS